MRRTHPEMVSEVWIARPSRASGRGQVSLLLYPATRKRRISLSRWQRPHPWRRASRVKVPEGDRGRGPRRSGTGNRTISLALKAYLVPHLGVQRSFLLASHGREQGESLGDTPAAWPAYPGQHGVWWSELKTQFEHQRRNFTWASEPRARLLRVSLSQAAKWG